MIRFKEWAHKVDYCFSEDPQEEFEIYIHYFLYIPDSEDMDEILRFLNDVGADERVIAKFNEAFKYYITCIKLIRTNTIKALKQFNNLKKELKDGSSERENELRYYMAAFNSVLKDLNPEQQRLVAYKYFKKMQHKNIVNSLGLTSSQVKHRLDIALGIISETLFSVWDIHKWSI